MTRGKKKSKKNQEIAGNYAERKKIWDLAGELEMGNS